MSHSTLTESFESVRDLINMNFDGIKEALESMLTQQPAKVTVSTFGNDSNVIGSKDELFTLLIHYEYLGYDAANQRAFIPNSEVRQELVLAIKNGQRPELIRLIQDSETLVQKTLDGDEAYVAQTLDTLHTSKVAPKFYNNEQALRSLIHQAYIAAIDDYVQIQELPSGTGYADAVFIPRKRSDRPAMIVELKFGGCTGGAIEQIKDRKYPTIVSEFTGNILMLLRQAQDFVKSNTLSGWEKLPNGRKHKHQYAERAVLEALVNHFIHRDYTVMGGEVHLDIANVSSERRNPILANVMAQLEYMEKRGSGLTRICNETRALDGYKEELHPTFLSTPTQFQTIIFASETNENVGEHVGDMSETLSVSSRTIERDLAALKSLHILSREGKDNDGTWIVTDIHK